MLHRITDDQWVEIVSVFCIIFLIGTMGGAFYAFYVICGIVRDALL